jgi:hypothetical protein
MFWLVRFLGLLGQAIFLQFVHLIGLPVFTLGIILGALRAPLWSIPVIGFVSGYLTDRYVGFTLFAEVFDKATSACERVAFLVIVHWVIAAGGYFVGAFGRRHLFPTRGANSQI